MSRQAFRIVTSRMPKHKKARFIMEGKQFVAKVYGHSGQPLEQNAALLKHAPEMLAMLHRRMDEGLFPDQMVVVGELIEKAEGAA